MTSHLFCFWVIREFSFIKSQGHIFFAGYHLLHVILVFPPTPIIIESYWYSKGIKNLTFMIKQAYIPNKIPIHDCFIVQIFFVSIQAYDNFIMRTDFPEILHFHFFKYYASNYPSSARLIMIKSRKCTSYLQ